LKGKLVVALRKGGRQGFAGTLLGHRKVEHIYRLGKSTAKQVLLALKRNQPNLPGIQLRGQMKAMNRRQEKERANPLIKVSGLTAELIKGYAFFQKLRKRKLAAGPRQRGITHLRI